VAQQETITEVVSRVAPKEQAVIHFGDKQAVQDTELLEEKKACQHELCVPDDWVDDYDPNKHKKPPAKSYPFELDPFQKACFIQLPYYYAHNIITNIVLL